MTLRDIQVLKLNVRGALDHVVSTRKATLTPVVKKINIIYLVYFNVELLNDS